MLAPTVGDTTKKEIAEKQTKFTISKILNYFVIIKILKLKTYLNSNYFFILYLLIQFIHLSSCKKNNNNSIDQPKIIQGKDSSLLIKSIRYQSKYVEEYYYDSINHKIILTSTEEDSDYPSSSKSELSYNSKHLLTGIIRKFKQSGSADTSIQFTVTIDYDDQDILQKIEERDFYGSIKTTIFNKTPLSTGNYQLTWTQQGHQLPNGTRITDTIQAVFNDSGQLISQLANFPYPLMGTPDDTITSATITKDSFVYDNQGSLIKVLTNYIDTFRNINDNFTYCQFTSRLNKGVNLFNQRQLILRGISNIPFSTTTFSGEAGVLSIFNTVEAYEYLKYPFQTIVLHNYSGNDDLSLTSLSEFDSNGRLTYFKGIAFLSERPNQIPNPLDFRITYY